MRTEDLSTSSGLSTDMKDCRMTKPFAGGETLPATRARRANADMAIGITEVERPTGARLVRALRASPLGDLDFDTASCAGPMRTVSL